jgi:iron-sulfur cluster assembly accessory protein
LEFEGQDAYLEGQGLRRPAHGRGRQEKAMPDGSDLPRFRVTPRAAAQVADIARREGRPEAGLRVSVSAGGCSGFQYGFELVDRPEADDLVVEAGGTRVFVDPVSLDLLAGSELDWNEALIGAHFVVQNPQAVSGCGCGVSFAVA